MPLRKVTTMMLIVKSIHDLDKLMEIDMSTFLENDKPAAQK